ncbi:large conductance mechanosensitive channel protein [Burkholderiales bacterium GJ-E10]|nr:large conductance mechanosensitive channel protein [Burkholderiales bacterium GJ-E10]
MTIASEFKEFAMRGNVIDLAVGVVVGGAFGKIVSSLVGDLIMPVVGVLTGGVNFADFALRIGTDPKGVPVLLKYGDFVQTILDFLIIALAIFLAVRAINKLKRPVPETVPAEPPPPPRNEVLLEEIRDLLSKRSSD